MVNWNLKRSLMFTHHRSVLELTAELEPARLSI